MLCSVLLVLAQAAAAPQPKAKAEAPPANAVGLVILLGAGKTAADADAAIAAFQRSGAASSVAPTRLLSTDVKGLKPGYHIAVLGACARGEAQAALEKVREVAKDAYLRWVPNEGEVAGMTCPSIQRAQGNASDSAEEDAGVRADGGDEGCTDGDCPKVEERVLTFEKDGYQLTLRVRTETESNGEFEASEWSAKAELRKGKAVVGTKEVSASNYASVEKFEVADDGLILDTLDLTSSCAGDEFYEGAHLHRLFRIVKGAIAVQERESPEFGMCSPSQEGASSCSYGCKMQRYEALKGVCTGATNRDRCMRAVERYDSKAKPCECD